MQKSKRRITTHNLLLIPHTSPHLITLYNPVNQKETSSSQKNTPTQFRPSSDPVPTQNSDPANPCRSQSSQPIPAKASSLCVCALCMCSVCLRLCLCVSVLGFTHKTRVDIDVHPASGNAMEAVVRSVMVNHSDKGWLSTI